MTVELVKFWMSGLNDWSLGNSKVKNRLSFSSSFILPQKFDPKAIIWGPVKVKVAQSCLTLCDPMDYTVSGIVQVRILEWVAFSFSRGSSQPRDQI